MWTKTATEYFPKIIEANSYKKIEAVFKTRFGPRKTKISHVERNQIRNFQEGVPQGKCFQPHVIRTHGGWGMGEEPGQ